MQTKNHSLYINQQDGLPHPQTITTFTNLKSDSQSWEKLGCRIGNFEITINAFLVQEDFIRNVYRKIVEDEITATITF